MKKISARAEVAVTAALMSSTACGTDDSHTAPEDCSTLAAGQSWYGDNKERITRFISETGRCGAAGSGTAPLAVFDWDNTVVKNDVGVAPFYNPPTATGPTWACTSLPRPRGTGDRLWRCRAEHRTTHLDERGLR